MLRNDRKEYLLDKNKVLIEKLNELIGPGPDKVMSQRKLALLLGCSNSTVTRWCNGESPMSIECASKICDIFHLNKREYIDYENLFDENIMSDLFLMLDDENKNKVYDYIKYLYYLQNKEELNSLSRKR